MIQNVKLYLGAVFTEVFLVQISSWDFVDESLKRLSITAGIVVAVFTAIKIYQDISIRHLDSKMKRLEIRKKEEEERRFFEQKFTNND